MRHTITAALVVSAGLPLVRSRSVASSIGSTCVFDAKMRAKSLLPAATSLESISAAITPRAPASAEGVAGDHRGGSALSP